MEHRWGERVQVDIPVRITVGPFAVRDGQLVDLSVSGALIETELHLRVMARVQVAILSRVFKHHAPTVAAYVTRNHKNGVGIEWCEFAPNAIAVLLRAAVARPYSRARRHAPTAALTFSRLSPPLLRHPAQARAPPHKGRDSMAAGPTAKA